MWNIFRVMPDFGCADFLPPIFDYGPQGPGKLDRIMLAAGKKDPVIHKETRQTRRHAWRDDRLAGLRK